MSDEVFVLPDSLTLISALRRVFLEAATGHEPIEMLSRSSNAYQSSFPSDVVLCRLSDGADCKLLVKYGTDHSHTGHGYWGNTDYEAYVYRELLEPLTGMAPKFYGGYLDPATGYTWLVLHYVDGWRLEKSPPEAVVWAARWLGEFHAAAQPCLSSEAMQALRTYDASYFSGWAERTAQYAAPLYAAYPWLPQVCARFAEFIPLLLGSAQTVVHGEYYPSNILVREQRIYPIDWQSAAMGPGEVDLASLLDNWGEPYAGSAKQAYCAARWSGSPPPEFEPALAAAQLYWVFRWLGDYPEWTVKEVRRHHFERLRSLSKDLGLI